jgi:hypothetical protein
MCVDRLVQITLHTPHTVWKCCRGYIDYKDNMRYVSQFAPQYRDYQRIQDLRQFDTPIPIDRGGTIEYRPGNILFDPEGFGYFVYEDTVTPDELQTNVGADAVLECVIPANTIVLHGIDAFDYSSFITNTLYVKSIAIDARFAYSMEYIRDYNDHVYKELGPILYHS